MPPGQRRAFFTLGRELDQQMRDDVSQRGEKAGLTKIEAEDLLDQLEAAGYELCQLSFDDGQGFRVRPNSGPEKDDPKLLAN